MKTILAIFAIIVQAACGADVVLYSTAGCTPAPALTSGLLVRYCDYDGTLLSSQFVATNGNATPPANPSRDLLTFAEWNIAGTNITQDTDIGANYATTDGKTYAFMSVTTVSGLTNVLYLNKAGNTNTLSVDWGDGVTSTFTNAGNFNTGDHIYPSNGNYVVKIWLSAGTGTYGFGNGGGSTSFSGGSVQVRRNMLTKCFIGSNVVTILDSAFASHYALSAVSIPTTTASLGSAVFQSCASFQAIAIPRSHTSIPNNGFSGCGSLLLVSSPASVITIANNAFSACASILSFATPISVTSIGSTMFDAAVGLHSLPIPTGVSNILESTFIDCRGLSFLTIPSGVTNIGATAFSGCTAMRYYNLLPTNPPTLASNTVFASIPSFTKIYVPDAYFDAYTNAPQWSTQPIPRSYIYPASQKP